MKIKKNIFFKFQVSSFREKTLNQTPTYYKAYVLIYKTSFIKYMYKYCIIHS